MPSTDDNTIPLNTDNPLLLAYKLSDLLIDRVIRDKPEFGDGVIATRTRELRDAVWPRSGSERLSKEQLQEVFQKAMSGLNDEQKSQLLEAYAHLGHLYDIAAQKARQNFFAGLKQKEKPVPGGVEDFARKQDDAATAVERLNKPVFEVVMTMHPTNINSLPFMQAQRALSIAMDTGDENTVIEALKTFQRTPVLHQDKDGKDANFTVRDETQIVVNFLNNVYDDMTNVYARCDQALKQFEDYHPLTLNLQARLGSWGSAGDKDGNSNVTAETTLEAIALHTQAILARYNKELDALPHQALEQNPALNAWKETISKASGALEPLLTDIRTLREDSIRLRKGAHDDSKSQALSALFDELSGRLAALREPLKPEKFTRDLVGAYEASSGAEEKAALLNMVRKVRMFGFTFSKIEYRETAEEYARVAERLIPGYETADPEMRVKRLSELLASENTPILSGVIKKTLPEIIRSGADRAYDDHNADPIAYHTLKRMELARDFPDMIQDNVLAECGKLKDDPNKPKNENGTKPANDGKETQEDRAVKSQGVANMLEAILMQRMSKKGDKQALLGVVPLFEEPETMKNISGIMEGTYDNKIYKEHMRVLANKRPTGELTQQVQIAHSDNSRRAGLQAARAYIHEAHRAIRQLNESKKIRTEFFEGGSISDAYRNGVRSISATTKELGLQDFAKYTFQGGDLLNFFNIPSSTERLFLRNIVNQAELLTQKDKRSLVSIEDKVAIEALKATQHDYQTQDFIPEGMGRFLGLLDYEGERRAGTVGSRAGERGGGSAAFGKVNSVKLGATIPLVPADKIRTIGMSETFQHAGIVPSWLGSQKLQEHLVEETRKALRKIDDFESRGITLNVGQQKFKDDFQGLKLEGDLTPKRVQHIYNHSPAFRDAQDRALFALALTDEDAFRLLEKKLKQYEPSDSKRDVENYIKHLVKTQSSAAKLAYAAREGKDLNGHAVQPAMMEALPRLSDDIICKTNYRSFLLNAKLEGGLSDHQRGIIHNASDTVSHGRWLMADDPAYSNARHPKSQQAGRAAA